jgi:hypothetical protein
LTSEVDERMGISSAAENLLIKNTEDFIYNLIESSKEVAKNRKSEKVVEVQDIQAVLESQYDIHIPYPYSDENTNFPSNSYFPRGFYSSTSSFFPSSSSSSSSPPITSFPSHASENLSSIAGHFFYPTPLGLFSEGTPFNAKRIAAVNKTKLMEKVIREERMKGEFEKRNRKNQKREDDESIKKDEK